MNSNQQHNYRHKVSGIKAVFNNNTNVLFLFHKGRPKRKKASKHRSVLDDTSDDDGPNTYDYNDSFLADDGEESGSNYSASDDSDWQPQGDDDEDDDVDEDVNELLTEARGFLRSKNMTKPV